MAVAVEAHSVDGFPKPFAFWTCLEGEPYHLQALRTRGLSCFPKVTAEKLQISWLQPIQYVAKLSKCCFLAVRCHYWHNQLFPRHQLSIISNDIGEFWVGIFISQSCIDQGVNAYDQPDRKISVFLTTPPRRLCDFKVQPFRSYSLPPWPSGSTHTILYKQWEFF